MKPIFGRSRSSNQSDFDQRLATMQRYGLHVLPLGDAMQQLYSRTLQEYAAAITVDDGFHSVHRLAVPCLQRYGFPATVYVTTYYVGNASPIFRLVVQYMFWKTRKQELVLKDVPWSTNQVVDLLNTAQTEQAAMELYKLWRARMHQEEMRCAICEELGVMLETPYEDIVRSNNQNLPRIDHLRPPYSGYNEDLNPLSIQGVWSGSNITPPVGAQNQNS